MLLHVEHEANVKYFIEAYLNFPCSFGKIQLHLVPSLDFTKQPSDEFELLLPMTG